MTMKVIYLLKAKDLLQGKIQPEDLTSKYVFLIPSGFTMNPFPQLAEALNFLAKFGWRAVGYSQRTILIEHID